jgi:beta-xylosidase
VTYRNPVLFADWSDPDVIGVRGDYLMTASSFNRVPGLPILRSADLVDWHVIGHALHRLVPEEHYSVPRPGCGVWAPALRFHDGRFWICYPDPDHGIYVITAADPAGPWTPPRLVLPGRGLIDPCPLWDEDGTAYLVHAWARSRCGFNNRLTAYAMSPDLDRPLAAGTVIVDGDAIDGCRTLEGPKWYRRDGWYWIFAPAGGVATGWQYAMRSRHVLGPYEPRVVLAQGDTDVNGPHQGAWVDDWFVHFQDRGAFGRVVHLQPLRWDDDGWPVIGDHGTPVPGGRRPVPANPSPAGVPGPQWTWPANPRPGRLLEPPGGRGLRLACVPLPGGDLRQAPNLLGRRLTGPRMRAETSVRLDAADGGRAGLAVYGRTYAAAGVEARAGGRRLFLRVADAAGEAETDRVDPIEVPAGVAVRLAVTVDEEAVARFAADLGAGWREFGPPFTATPGHWVGATVALFATGTGFADFEPVVS